MSLRTSDRRHWCGTPRVFPSGTAPRLNGNSLVLLPRCLKIRGIATPVCGLVRNDRLFSNSPCFFTFPLGKGDRAAVDEGGTGRRDKKTKANSYRTTYSPRPSPHRFCVPIFYGTIATGNRLFEIRCAEHHPSSVRAAPCQLPQGEAAYNRFVMLFMLMPNVDMLCSSAEVVGGRMPTRPRPIRPQLKPMINR